MYQTDEALTCACYLEELNSTMLKKIIISNLTVGKPESRIDKFFEADAHLDFIDLCCRELLYIISCCVIIIISTRRS
jgi:hypothetical protein